MRQYIVRRLLLFIPTLFLVSVIIFSLLRMIPGDIAEALLIGAGEGKFTQEDIEKLRHELGLNRPLYVQYVSWLWDMARGNLGNSMWTGEPISKILKNRFPLTIELAFLTLFVSFVIAIPTGVLSAIRQDTWVDYVFRVVSIAGLAMPIFWTGILIIFFLVLFFDWMPPLGYASPFDDPLKNLQQLIWPAVAQGYMLAAILSRMTRSSMLEVLRQDYVRTAWAKGLSEKVIIYRHALKNAILPVVTLSGVQFGALLGGVVIMETVFSLPGMGRNLVEAIGHRDYTLIEVMILLICLIYLFINLIVDLLYGWLDPRIRYQ